MSQMLADSLWPTAEKRGPQAGRLLMSTGIDVAKYVGGTRFASVDVTEGTRNHSRYVCRPRSPRPLALTSAYLTRKYLL